MLTAVQINFLNSVCNGIGTEEHDVISVEGSVNMNNMNLTEIPVQFGQVTSDFMCNNNKLTILKKVPSIIRNNFNCDSNLLTTLEEGPAQVGVWYTCQYNKLINLIGAPEICNDDFYCFNNQLTSLEGCPKLVSGIFNCRGNPNLEYLWGIGKVKGRVYYDNQNEINKWIIECMRKDIIFPYLTLEENINWIKITGQYSILFMAPNRIRVHFSPKILHLVDFSVFLIR